MLWSAVSETMRPHTKLKWLMLVVLFCSNGLLVVGQTLAPKIFRGTIGSRHIEMRLVTAGGKVSGSYFYDQFRQDIILEGGYNPKGQLELIEGTGKRKTGKFVCKPEETFDWDLECEWSRPDGTGQAMVFLVEQGIQVKTELRVVPKLMNDRKTKAVVSYPQLTAAVITPGLSGFNQLIESRVQAAVKEFQPETIAHSSFDTNYNVLFADDDKVSIEMAEYSDVGAAHPDTRLWTVNYNLRTNKELTLDDVFRSGDEYKTTIAEFVTRDINRRADQMEIDEARRNNRQPEKRDEPMMETDRLPDMDTWAFSPKGFVVYFDFPHVMAVFDKAIVPYSILSRYLSPNGIAPVSK